MKLVKNSDIMLTVNGNGVPIFFEPVRSQQTMLCIEGHKRSYSRTFEVLLTDFFQATFSPKHVVVVINRPIKMKVCFTIKPNVIEPAGSFAQAFHSTSCTSRFSSFCPVAVAQWCVEIQNRNRFRSFLMTLKSVVGDIASSWAWIQ